MGQGYYNQSEVTTLGDIAGGFKVERAAAEIAAVSVALFTVIGGRIVLRDLIGEVVTTLGAVASLIHIDAECTAGGATAMCIDSADIANDILALKYHLPATAAAATTISTGDAALGITPRWIIPAGTINLHASAAPGSGTVKWAIRYVPFDFGAYIEAA